MSLQMGDEMINNTPLLQIKQVELMNSYLPPALLDKISTLQSTDEQELTYLLCMNPYRILEIAGAYLPEISQRERAFWLLVKKILPKSGNTIEDVSNYLYILALENGFKFEMKKWEARYMDTFFSNHPIVSSEERAIELLCQIKAAHESRVGLEIIYRIPRFRNMAVYYG